MTPAVEPELPFPATPTAGAADARPSDTRADGTQQQIRPAPQAAQQAPSPPPSPPYVHYVLQPQPGAQAGQPLHYVLQPLHAPQPAPAAPHGSAPQPAADPVATAEPAVTQAGIAGADGASPAASQHSAAAPASIPTSRAAPRRFGLVAQLPWRIRYAAYGIAASLVAAGLWLGAMLIYYTTEYPNPLAVRSKERAPVIRILARDGTVLADRGTAHDFMPIDMLPQHVIDAVVATEDRRFFSHWGIDPAGMTRAAFANLRAGRFVQGGSTLTQQLAKNLFLSSERTMSRKLDELSLAVWLEVRLTKREIIELYLNRVYFGGGAYGIEAAAQRYFDKSARALSVAEAALIAGLLKAPSKYSPTSNPSLARARGQTVLAKMRDAGFISPRVFVQASKEHVRFADHKGQRSATGFEYVIDLVLEKMPPVLGEANGELIVETTIDTALQRHANDLVAKALAGRGKSMGASQAAVVALDNDGGIVALVGGRSYVDSQFNRVTKARRQPGSVFKPFVYLTAIEKGLTPDTVTYDLPLTIDGWSPRNDNGEYVGALTLRQALAQSINTVAVRLDMDVGIATVVETARRLGVTSELRQDPSMALGTSEMTLMELVGAYGVLASGGIAIEPHVIRRVRLNTGRVLFARAAPQQGRVVAAEHAGAMNDMLNAALVAGTGRRAALPRHPAAGKTGTTQDFRDAWFIGYTAHMTTGIWIGNDDSSPMQRVMGGNLPAEMWHELMLEAHQHRQPHALPGTEPMALMAGNAQTPPVARTERPEVLPWLAPKEAASGSSVMRATAPAAVAATEPRRPRPSIMRVDAGGSAGNVGQRLVIEPPRTPKGADRRSSPAIAATASGGASAGAYPKDRISEAFLAKVLQTPPPRMPALAQRSPRFDATDIKRRIETAPAQTARSEPPALPAVPASNAATPRGMMSLGLGLNAAQ